ncbi:DEAH-box ATP-dependent RNA helicase prp43 [Elasticomyces elasticus]|nr:DEAH-box ATP-dependent RNA helicase prp43 [Elasticomyces elasticus]
MRFGITFQQSQIPRWASFYLAYDELKKDLRASLGPTTQEQAKKTYAVRERTAKQYAAVDELCKFELKRLAVLHQRFAKLLCSTVPAQGSSPWIHADVCRLLRFAKSNSEAASRILAKIERVSPAQEEGLGAGAFEILDVTALLRLEARILSHLQDVAALDDRLELPLETLLRCADTVLRPFLPDRNNMFTRVQLFSGDLHLISQLAGFDIAHRESDMIVSGTQYREEPANVAFWDEIVSSQVEKLVLDDMGLSHLSAALDSCGRLPLHYAAEYGLTRVALTLSISVPEEELGGKRRESPRLQADSIGLTPMHLAACSGHADTLAELLRATSGVLSPLDLSSTFAGTLARNVLESGNAGALPEVFAFVGDVDLNDNRGQSLLCVAVRIAASLANKDLVQLLLDHGGAAHSTDSRGWTPREHAAYRGHIEIVELLDRTGAGPCSHNRPLSGHAGCKIDAKHQPHIPWIREDYQSFNGTYVWITLGNIDANKSEPALQLRGNLTGYNTASRRRAEVLYSLSISSGDDPKLCYTCDLPSLQRRLNEPWLFPARSVTDFSLHWQLFKETSHPFKTLVGTGTTLLGAQSSHLRPNMESLVRGITTPLQSPEDSSLVGTVYLSYFWVTPHPPPPPLATAKYWEFGNGIGGHRGSGKNRLDHKQLQLGENTAFSFLKAVEHGASFIEFDVQLTKDLIPVVYHDFLLSETGTDSRMHDLSSEQFEFISQAQDPRRPRGKRSNSFEAADRDHLQALAERMAYTYFNKVNGFKANTRGLFIHGRSSTLEDIFRKIPKDVHMNIELKYPMLFECDEWNMELIAIKADLFVSTVLDKVYEHAEGRTIVFSSFSPEVCIALSTKQRTWPVFFLSKTSGPRGEIRSELIQQAVHFAQSWGLPEVVTECTPLIRCPRLIRYVKDAGLTLMSFGALNADPEYVKVQFESGIDAVISDSVGAIVRLKQDLVSHVESAPVRVYAAGVVRAETD